MLILWIRKSKTSEPKISNKNDKKSFQKHDEDMKKFRLSHPDMNIISANDILTTDGDILAPVHKVKLTEHAQN